MVWQVLLQWGGDIQHFQKSREIFENAWNLKLSLSLIVGKILEMVADTRI